MSIPTILQTDLYHFHADPDDHWDLATEFALAYISLIDLKGVLIDYPPDKIAYFPFSEDPAIQAVNQMNYITGLAVPMGVGASEDQISGLSLKEGSNISGINMVLKILRESDEPVAIHIVGSCRDIAIAGNMEPELFRNKCKGIYLNAGSGINRGMLDHNVNLNPLAYSAMFRLPCPVYWLPCFNDMNAFFTIGVNGTFYKFMQGDVIPYLSDKVQKFFAYALGRIEDHRWLKYLISEKDQELIDKICGQPRNMWCTAGFLHGAGKTVTTEGEIISLDTAESNTVFSFEPITVHCGEDGITSWQYADNEDKSRENEPPRYIFKVNDTNKYEEAMTKALKTLLMNLP